MAKANLSLLLKQLRQVVHGRGVMAGIPDSELVERFVKNRDEAAFEVLVWRHGPMVLSLCERMLHNVHDAEDVFQATFLILARQANSIANREAAGSWLYKVAHRCALRARTQAALRTRKQSTLTDDVPAQDLAAQASWQELRPVLDDAIQELPEKYRTVIVLHYLEGRNSQQVACELRCPVGTVTSRLTRARELLRAITTRRGVTLPAALLGAALAQATADAAARPGLVLLTLNVAKLANAGKAAAAAIPTEVLTLAQGVTRAMFLTKLKIAALLFLALSIAGLGTGVLTFGAQCEPGDGITNQGSPPAPVQTREGQEAPPKDAVEPKVLFAKAAKAISAIPDEAQKAYALLLVAQAQAAAGQRQVAAKTLREAVEIARTIQHKDEYPKGATLMRLAIVQADVGEVADAIRTAEEIQTQRVQCRDRAFAHIASAQAKAGDVNGAMDTVGRIKDSDQGFALKLVATRQLEAGNVKAALQTAGKIQDASPSKVEALSVIALAQARAGEGDAALRTLKALQDATKDLDDDNGGGVAPSQKGYALLHIGMARAEIGDSKGAVQIADSFTKGSYLRDSVMARVARADIRAGKSKDALRIVETLSDGVQKNEVLLVLVGRQTKAKDFRGARKTIEAMEFPEKAQALSQLAAAQMAAGDPAAAAAAFREAVAMVVEPGTLWTEEGDMSAGPLHLHPILAAWAEAGEAKGALAWVEKQDSPFVKSVTLAAVAEGLAKRKAAEKRSPEKK